jgi:integrase
MTIDQLTSETANQCIIRWRLQDYAAGTIHTRRKKLKFIIAWMIDCGAPRSCLKLTKLRPPRPRVVIAEGDELERLFVHAKGWMDCWLIITAQHGLRFAEAQKLSRRNYNPEMGTITYRTKGESTNSIPASAELRVYLESITDQRLFSVPLIDVLAGESLSSFQVRNAWRNLKRRAQVNPDLRPHDLRRTLAVRLYNKTGDLRQVQNLLGHSNFATTCTYLEHRNPADLAAVLRDLVPVGIRRHIGQLPRVSKFQN